MTGEEADILTFLRENPEGRFARKEIARKSVKRTFYEEHPHWVDQPLAALVARKLVQIDDDGFYRIASL